MPADVGKRGRVEVEASDPRQLDQRRADPLPEQEREHQVDPVQRAGVDLRVELVVGGEPQAVAARAAESRRCRTRAVARGLGRHHGRHLPAPTHRCSSAATAERLCLPMKIALTRSPSYSAEGAAPDLVPREVARRPRRPRAAPAPPALAGSSTSAASASRSAAGSSGGTSSRGAVLAADLGEAADVGEHHRLAEGERGVEHARLVDPPVGQHHHVGAAEEGRDLRVGHEAVDEPDRPAGALRGRA